MADIDAEGMPFINTWMDDNGNVYVVDTLAGQQVDLSYGALCNKYKFTPIYRPQMGQGWCYFTKSNIFVVVTDDEIPPQGVSLRMVLRHEIVSDVQMLDLQNYYTTRPYTEIHNDSLCGNGIMYWADIQTWVSKKIENGCHPRPCPPEPWCLPPHRVHCHRLPLINRTQPVISPVVVEPIWDNPDPVYCPIPHMPCSADYNPLAVPHVPFAGDDHAIHCPHDHQDHDKIHDPHDPHCCCPRCHGHNRPIALQTVGTGAAPYGFFMNKVKPRE